jgi:lipid-A-disaccharide synthase
LSIFGWFEGLTAYPRVVARVNDTVALAQREAPDVVVLIDSWGFTLRVAQQLRRQQPKLPLIKYVGPQVWASRPGRAKTLARTVDHLLSILAFDAPYFEKAGLPVTAVGNPVLARDLSGVDPDAFRRTIGATADEPILLVLPGSRPSEIDRLMGPFAEAVALVKADRPNLRVVLAAAETVADKVRAGVEAWPVKPQIVEGEAARLAAMRAATVALACSGTVTTELAMAGCAMVVAYKFSAVTYAVAKPLVRTPWGTLLNIAAGRMIAPEFLQAHCTGAELAQAVAARLDDPVLRASQVADQSAALDLMGPRGGPDPAERAADAVIAILEGRKP